MEFESQIKNSSLFVFRTDHKRFKYSSLNSSVLHCWSKDDVTSVFWFSCTEYGAISNKCSFEHFFCSAHVRIIFFRHSLKMLVWTSHFADGLRTHNKDLRITSCLNKHRKKGYCRSCCRPWKYILVLVLVFLFLERFEDIVIYLGVVSMFLFFWLSYFVAFLNHRNSSGCLYSTLL